jgi:hypothetical protein
VDGPGQPLDGAKRYTMRFAPGQLPNVNASFQIRLIAMRLANELKA